MSELKPCPLPTAGVVHNPKVVTALGESWVLCTCGASGPMFSDVDGSGEQKAIEAWNTRAERTCVLEDIPYEPGAWEGVRCSSCKVTDEDTDLTGNYCPNCGTRLVKS